MKPYAKRVVFLHALLMVAGITFLAGCGGGGGGNPVATAVPSGNGRVSAAVHFKHLSELSRRADQTAGVVEIEIEITGYYGVDNSQFVPVTAETDVSISSGQASISVLNVPIGVNHLLEAEATYPDGFEEYVRVIIPQVVEGLTTQVSADERTTVIADAAVLLASSSGKTLSQISSANIEKIEQTVDYYYAQGTPYSQMTSESLIAFQTNAEVADSISVTPTSASLAVGDSIDFSAVVKNIYGDAISGATITWSVTGGIGRVADGTFTATTEGSGTVVATSGNLSASAQITVTESPLVSMAITPNPASTLVNSTLQFYATASDAAGDSMSVSPTWSLSGDIGTISTDGILSATTAGSGIVTATYDTLTATAEVTVTDRSVSSVTVSPASASVIAGETQQFTAVALDADGVVVSVSFTWTVAGSAGIIDGNGLFTGNIVGTDVITASAGGVDGTAAVTVSAGVLSTITVTPDTTSVLLGNSTTFSATGADAFGNSVSITPTWTISGVGTIDPASGSYAATEKGTATITATADGISGTADVTVPNTAPTANAGTDQSAETGLTVTLDATGSTDPDTGDTLYYTWTQTAGDTVTLSSTTAEQPTFVPVTVGTYTFSLTVSDGTDTSAADTVSVTVTASTAPTVTAVSPTSATNDVATSITITGTNFQSGATADLSGTLLTNVVVVSSTQITADVPAGLTAGTYNVSVTNPDAQADALMGGFTILNPTATTHSGVISASETWAAADSPHQVTGTVQVYASGNPVLTIEAGAIVQFDSGTKLEIGNTSGYPGTLVADGSAGSILFTSSATTPGAGDWQGVVLTNQTQSGTILDTVTIEYAGATTGAGLSFNGTTTPTVDNCTIQNNSGLGVLFADGSYPASFTANTITGNSSYPVEIYAEYLRTLPSGNTYTGNGVDAIKVNSDNVFTSGTWAYSGVPLEIQGDIYVYASGGPVLTIDPNSTLQFLTLAGLYISNSSGYPGSLVADGSGGTITFTSAQSTPAAGDWDGIFLDNFTQSGSILDNCIIEYAGAQANGAALVVRVNNSTISNNTISDSSTVGVKFMDGGGGYNAFTGNTVTASALQPIDVYANYMPTIPAGNTLTGNGTDVIQVQGGSSTISGTWANNGIPVQVLATVLFGADTTFADNMNVEFLADVFVYASGGPTLTFGAGGTYSFASGAGITVSSSSGYPGTFIADGSAGGAITLTSNTSSTPGSWEGILFDNFTGAGTLLNNVIVEYAGQTTGAGISFSGTSVPEIYNCTIQNNSGLGVTFADGDFPAAFSGNTITGNTTYPIEIYPEYLRYMTAANTYTGNTIDQFKLYSDVVASSGTWIDQGIPYLVAGDIYIYDSGNPNITVSAGTTFLFDTGTGITVSNSSGYPGTFVADGSLGVITFTSSQSTPAAGDWDGIFFDNYTQSSSVLNDVVIEYAGSQTNGASLVSRVNGPTITNNTIQNGSAIGVKFMDGGGGNGTFTNNTITGHASYAMEIFAEYVSSIPGSNTISGNGEDAIYVQSDSVTTAGTWPNEGVPFITIGVINIGASVTLSDNTDMDVGGDIYVYASGNPVFTVGPGSTLKFATGTGITISNASGYPGTFVADGSGGTITFTSGETTPYPGAWDGIYLDNYTQSGTVIDSVIIEYGGGGSNAANLTVQVANASIDNNTIRYSGATGVKFEDGGGAVSFTGNTVTSNNGQPIDIFGEYLSDIGSGNTLSGNGEDFITVQTDTVTTAGTWDDNGIVIEIDGILVIGADITLEANTELEIFANIAVYASGDPTLTIGASSTLSFATSTSLTIGYSGGYPGGMDASAGGITFTTLVPTPYQGAWVGIIFDSYTSAGTVINYGTVEYGGGNGFGNVYFKGSGTNATITNSAINYSGSYGVYVPSGQTYSTSDEASCSFTGNFSGTVFRL